MPTNPTSTEGATARVRLIHLICTNNRHSTAMTDAFGRMCEKASSLGWSFEMVAPESTRGASWAAYLASRGAVIHYIEGSGRRKSTAEIARVLGADRAPALLHTHHTGYDIPAALAVRNRPMTSLFWHFHSFLPSGRTAALRRRVKFLMFRASVDRLVAQSENIHDGLVSSGVPPGRIVMFSSGIDPSLYPPRTSADRQRERARIDVPDSSTLLLHFGWDLRIKGTDRFLKAVRLLLDSGMEITAIVNRGEDKAEREAERLGLRDVVRFEGLVEDTRPLYIAADCMVAPSRGEGMPFSVVEALATGLPVVASELTGHRYLADRIEACSVVDPTPENLAGAIRAIVERPTEVASAQEAQGASWIAQNLNVDTIVDGLFESYEEALASRGVAGRAADPTG